MTEKANLCYSANTIFDAVGRGDGPASAGSAVLARTTKPAAVAHGPPDCGGAPCQDRQQCEWFTGSRPQCCNDPQHHGTLHYQIQYLGDVVSGHGTATMPAADSRGHRKHECTQITHGHGMKRGQSQGTLSRCQRYQRMRQSIQGESDSEPHDAAMQCASSRIFRLCTRLQRSASTSSNRENPASSAA